jgi:hypothetical protein
MLTWADIRRPAWLPTFSVWVYICLCNYTSYFALYNICTSEKYAHLMYVHLFIEQVYAVGSSSSNKYTFWTFILIKALFPAFILS